MHGNSGSPTKSFCTHGEFIFLFLLKPKKKPVNPAYLHKLIAASALRSQTKGNDSSTLSLSRGGCSWTGQVGERSHNSLFLVPNPSPTSTRGLAFHSPQTSMISPDTRDLLPLCAAGQAITHCEQLFWKCHNYGWGASEWAVLLLHKPT